MRNRTTGFLAFLSFVLAVSVAYAAEPLKIGLSLGLTGRYSAIAEEQMKGFRLWEREANGKGGILGRKVKLIVYDDASDPAKAKELYERLITTDRVDLVFGPYSSEITEAVVPVTEKHGFPLLASGANADRLWQKGYKYLFGMWLPASKDIMGFLELLVLNNLKKLSIVYADDPYSKDVAAGARRWAGRFGLDVVLFQGFAKGTANLDGLVKKIIGAEPDVLIVSGHLDEAVNMRLALKAARWYPKAFYGSSGPATHAFFKKIGADADYVFSNSRWEYGGGPGCCEFYESFSETYGEAPSYYAATAYAAGEIIAAAVEKADGLDRGRIRDILSSLDMLTIMGRYGVDKSGMQTKQFNLVIQWQRGIKEIVWPEKARTAKPVFR